jgi:NADPH-dependent glutamate synthase beta subunit-like oxidoreductase/CO/xanthine dehydrogenase FAD-binding subunit
MKPYKYKSAGTIKAAVSFLKNGKASVLAGGTDILNLLKQGALAEPPEILVNIKRIPGLNTITYGRSGLKIGALTTIHTIAASELVKDKYPALAQAASSVAGPTLRNMATLGGNLCEEVQCWYFRRSHLTGTWFNCLRKDGASCYAFNGDNRYHSLFGGIKVTPSPCTNHCPAGTEIPAYLAKIRSHDLDAAARVILKVNPLAAVTGRVCPHFCESACNRNEYSTPVSVKNIERFMGDYILGNASKFIQKRAQEKRKRIAIIGSGPAGLSAAYFLTIAGYQVTVFETMPFAGGTMALTIPDYRLPESVLKRAIDFIGAHGIAVKTKTAIGKDLTIPQLLQQGFRAVFIAIGAQEGRKLNIPGNDLEGVMTGLDFLRKVKMGRKTDIGARLLVVGGGSIGFDCARTARRLGAKEVRIACLESRETMPADPDEIREGEAEGIQICPSQSVIAIRGEDGRAQSVECLAVASLTFIDGAPEIKTIPGSESTSTADTVIFAIGQVPDLSVVAGVKGLKISRTGTIKTDPDTLSTGVKGIFAGGDVSISAGSVIEAIACGTKAAASIHRFLGGRADIVRSIETEDALLRFNCAGMQAPRIVPPELSVEERLQDVTHEVVQGLPREAVTGEANRCRNCGCVAVHSSDLATALVALNAKIITSKRVIPAEEFFAASGSKTTVLDSDELVLEITVPPAHRNSRQTFLKFAQRPTIDFAIVNAAAVLKIIDGKVTQARIVLGSVAPVPYRAYDAESVLIGKAVTEKLAERAATTLGDKAVFLDGNGYKLQIAKTLLKRAVLGQV